MAKSKRNRKSKKRGLRTGNLSFEPLEVRTLLTAVAASDPGGSEDTDIIGIGDIRYVFEGNSANVAVSVSRWAIIDGNEVEYDDTQVAEEDITVQLLASGVSFSPNSMVGTKTVTILAGEGSADTMVYYPDDCTPQTGSSGGSVSIDSASGGGQGGVQEGGTYVNKKDSFNLYDNGDANFRIRSLGPVEEGETAEFEIHVTSDITSIVNASLEFKNGSATGFDYSRPSEPVPLTFSPTLTSQIVSVDTTPDTDYSEGSEFFFANVICSDADHPVIASTTQTINDQEQDPISVTLEAVGSRVTEGESAKFEVTINQPQNSPVTVDVVFVDGSAVKSNQGTGVDYSGNTIPVTFSAMEETKTISVATYVNVDNPNGTDQTETFSAQLANPNPNTVILNGNPTITIEERPVLRLSVAGSSVTEKDEDFVTTVAEITLSGPPDQNITVSYVLTDLEAVNGPDYTGSTSGAVTFSTSDSGSGLTKSITKTIQGDDVSEYRERFRIDISAPSSTSGSEIEITKSSDMITISDDDSQNDFIDNDDDDEDNDKCKCPQGGNGGIDQRRGVANTGLRGPTPGVVYPNTIRYSGRSAQNVSGIATARISLPAGSAQANLIDVEAIHNGEVIAKKVINTALLSNVPSNGQATFDVAFDLGLTAGPLDELFEYSLRIRPRYSGQDVPHTYEIPQAMVVDAQAVNSVNPLAPGFGFDFIERLYIGNGRAYVRTGSEELIDFQWSDDAYMPTNGGVSRIISAPTNGDVHAAMTAYNLPGNRTWTWMRVNPDGSHDVFFRYTGSADKTHYKGLSVDASGNDTLFKYDNSGHITDTWSAEGHQTEFTYTGAYLTRIRQHVGSASSSSNYTDTAILRSVNGNGAVDWVVAYADTTLDHFKVNSSGKLLEHNSGNEHTTYGYDANGFVNSVSRNDEVTSITSAISGYFVAASQGTESSPFAVQPAPQVNGQVYGSEAVMTDARGNSTTYVLDSFGNPIQITDADGNVTAYERDGDGRVTRMTEPGNRVTQYDRDARGNVTKITHPDSSTERFEFHPVFNVETFHVDATNNVTQTVLGEETGNPIEVNRYVNVTGQFNRDWQNFQNRFDVNGDQLVTFEDAQMVLDYATSQGGVLGPWTSNSPYYNVNGSFDTVEQAETLDPFDTFDIVNFLYGVVGLDGSAMVTTRTSYTVAWNGIPAGLVKETIDPNGVVTKYDYYNNNDGPGAAGKLKQIIYPTGGKQNYRYDSMGRILVEADPAGNNVAYRYLSSSGRLHKKSAPLPVDFSIYTDAQIAWIVNAVPGTTYTYDSASGTTEGLYEMVDSEGLKTRYFYDAEGQLSQTFVGAGTALALRSKTIVDQVGNLHVELQGNGAATTWLATMHHYDSMNRRIATIETHPEGNHPAWQNPFSAGDVNADGARDAKDQDLISEYLGSQSSKPLPDWLTTTEFFYYDVNGDGQVTTLDRQQVFSAIPAAVHAARPTTFYQYNDNGELVAQQDPNGAVTTFEYDSRGRQTHVIQDDPTSTTALTFPLVPGDFNRSADVFPTTRTSYDAEGRVRYTMGPRGMAQLNDSNPDPYFERTDYYYDELGRVKEIRLPTVYDGLTLTNIRPSVEYEYDRAGNVTRHDDALNRRTTNQYDATTGLLDTTILPAPNNQTVQPKLVYQYDTSGRVTHVTETALNRTTEYQYSRYGTIERMIHPQSDFAGDVVGNRQTRFTYDTLGNRLSQRSVFDPSGASAYDLGDLTEYQYDALHRLEYVIGSDYDDLLTSPNPSLDPASVNQTRPVSQTKYDSLGRVEYTIDPLQRETKMEYDDLGRLETVTYPDKNTGVAGTFSASMTYEYDLNGNVRFQTNALNEQTEFTYDILNRRTAMIEPSSTGDVASYTFTTDYTYDLSGNRKTLTDPDSNQWIWQYDGLNRAVRETAGEAPDPVFGDRRFRYDLAGNLVYKKDRIGRVTRYEYDDADRMEFERWYSNASTQNASHVISFGYDAANRMNSSSDDAHNYAYAYDDLDQLRVRVADVSSGPTTVFAIAYDERGHRMQVDATSVSSNATRGSYTDDFEFDYLGRKSQVDHQTTFTATNTVSNDSATFEYYLDGQMEKIERNDGGMYYTEYDYDSAGRLTLIDNQFSPSGYVFGYDKANRLTSFTVSNHAAESVNTYDYDARSQLTSADRTGFDESYEYDENGNRLRNGNDEAADKYFNRIGFDADGNKLYRDAEGNLNQVQQPSGSSEYRRYIWDHRNRLKIVLYFENGNADPTTGKLSGGNLVQSLAYLYDASNQMVRRRHQVFGGGGGPIGPGGGGAGGGQLGDGDGVREDPANAGRSGGGSQLVDLYFAYDEGQVVIQSEKVSSVAAPTDFYLWGVQTDHLLAVESEADGTRWAFTDHQGTVRDWVDNSGFIDEHISYDSFGNVVDTAGNVVSGGDDVVFGYTGRLTDKVSGLQNNLNRWYDPAVGRWISEDPIGFAAGDSNLYRYVGNSPTNFTDPTGQEANNPNAMVQRANPGSFTVRINRSMRSAASGAVDCGQKDVEARYTPSAAEMAKYSKIFLTVFVRTDTKQHAYPDNVFGNDAWHLDRPKDPDDLVRWPDEGPAAIWTDDPGQAPNSILLPGAKKSLEQEWEVVAWGIPKNGGKIELLGAVRYGFKADWTYSACGDPCKCTSTVRIGNQKRNSDTMTLENIPPQNSTMPFSVWPVDLSK